jgi:hypothetical protein
MPSDRFLTQRRPKIVAARVALPSRKTVVRREGALNLGWEALPGERAASDRLRRGYPRGGVGGALALVRALTDQLESGGALGAEALALLTFLERVAVLVTGIVFQPDDHSVG